MFCVKSIPVINLFSPITFIMFTITLLPCLLFHCDRWHRKRDKGQKTIAGSGSGTGNGSGSGGGGGGGGSSSYSTKTREEC